MENLKGSPSDQDVDEITNRAERSLRISRGRGRSNSRAWRGNPPSATPIDERRRTLELKALDNTKERKEEWKKRHPMPPSKIKDDPWCWAYSPQYHEKPGDYEKGGKWLIFEYSVDSGEYGYTKSDYVWFRVEELVHLGTFWMAKTSTGRGNELSTDETIGVIMIYTENASNTDEVVECAGKICEHFDMKNSMNYKTNEASRSGKYAIKGDENISSYRCGVDGVVERRTGSCPLWIPVNTVGTKGGENSSSNQDAEEITNDNGINSRDSRCPPARTKYLDTVPNLKCKAVDNTEEKREEWRKIHPTPPSKVKDSLSCDAYSPFYSRSEKFRRGGKWLIFQNCVDRDDFGYTNFDYVWFRVEELVQNGFFYMARAWTGLKLETSLNKSVGVIGIYNEDAGNIEEMVEYAGKICKLFELTHSMYYKSNKDSLSGKNAFMGFKNPCSYRCRVDGVVEMREGSVWIPLRTA